MNIVSFSSFNQVVVNFKEHFVSLGFKQRVVVIALAALNALVACVLVYRQCFMKAKQVVGEDQPVDSNILQKVLNDQGGVIIKKVTYPDGVIENGSFVDNRLEGKGEIIFPNGNKHEGFFKHGRLNGEGKLTLFDGSIFTGTFKGGQLTQGEITSKKVKAIGIFKNGKLEGKGKKIYADGSKEIGNFKQGKFCGEGEISYLNGYKEKGHFELGVLEGQGERFYADGTREMGHFKNGHLEGQGERLYADASREKGEFADGMLHGQAEIIFSDQTKYRGICEEGDFQNNITKIAPDGTETIEKDTLTFFSDNITVYTSFPETSLKFPYAQCIPSHNLIPVAPSIKQKDNQKKEDLIEPEN